MKYVKNLIKREKSGILSFALVEIFLHIALFVSGVYTFYNDVPHVDVPGMISLIIITCAGMYFYVGILVTSPYSQDDSDYDVTSDNEFIYVVFKNREFFARRSDVMSAWFFRDKNKRFVSFIRRCQIYRYVMAKHKRLANTKVDEEREILQSEIVNKFAHVRKMSTEEKTRFLKDHKIKDKLQLSYLIPSFVFSVYAILFAIVAREYLVEILTLKFTMLTLLSGIMMTPMALWWFAVAKESIISISRRKNAIKQFMNQDIYMVACAIYDKRVYSARDYIRITDGKYIVSEWIAVPSKEYAQDDSKVRFYAFDQAGRSYFSMLYLV